MAKQKSKSKRAAGTPAVPPKYGQLFEFGFYYPGVNSATFDPVDPEQVALCRRWLELHARPRNRISFRTSSYSLKHTVERWCETFGPHRYISGGAFIQAAIDLGYRYVRRGPKAHFNIAPVRDVIKEDDERALTRRGRSLTWDEHVALSQSLNSAEDFLNEAFAVIRRTYGKREYLACGHVFDAIHRVRMLMESRACGEHARSGKNPTALYFKREA